jgi:molecular chaperone HtpG
MTLIINTFYTNKEIFLRELILNCLDVCNKILHESIKNSKVYKEQKELKIDFLPNKEKNVSVI